MAKAAADSKAKRGRRSVALSRDSIVAAAVELAGREGTAALTLRRLGLELGVDPTAFYRHFPDKDALILAVGDHVTAWSLERARELDVALPWQERIRGMARTLWAASEEFPGILALTSARTTGEAAEREIVEWLLEIVEPLGLDGRRTVLVYRMLGDTLLALAGQNGFLTSMEPELREKDASAWSRIYSAQSRDEHPATWRHLPDLLAVDDAEIFTFAVDTLIAGIEALVAREGRPAA